VDKINREKSLIILKSMKNQILSREILDSDGDTLDESALDYCGEILFVIEILESQAPDALVFEAARKVGLEAELKLN
jgi:hypothetical protein